MTATLVAKDLSGGHDHRTLFSGLSLTVAPGDVVGVVGANGAGKSTLLRLLAGVDQAQGGTVSLAPADAFVGWLPQEHERIPGETVAAYIARRTGCAKATAEMESTAEALGSGTPGADDAYSLAFDRWMASGAADLDERIAPVLADLGLEVGPDAEMTRLSGGQAARVALAALLLSRFDVVLLDEPTNDLDLDGLARLEAFVQGLRGGAVLVSHDREFLARCVTSIVELDLAQNSVAVYDGGYESFLEERAVARRHGACTPARLPHPAKGSHHVQPHQAPRGHHEQRDPWRRLDVLEDPAALFRPREADDQQERGDPRDERRPERDLAGVAARSDRDEDRADERKERHERDDRQAADIERHRAARTRKEPAITSRPRAIPRA